MIITENCHPFFGNVTRLNYDSATSQLDTGWPDGQIQTSIIYSTVPCVEHRIEGRGGGG
jgi:hypothetical protein